MQYVDNHGSDEGEGEQEGRTKPVDNSLGGFEVLRSMAGNRRKSEPLVRKESQ